MCLNIDLCSSTFGCFNSKIRKYQPGLKSQPCEHYICWWHRHRNSGHQVMCPVISSSFFCIWAGGIYCYYASLMSILPSLVLSRNINCKILCFHSFVLSVHWKSDITIFKTDCITQRVIWSQRGSQLDAQPLLALLFFFLSQGCLKMLYSKGRYTIYANSQIGSPLIFFNFY